MRIKYIMAFELITIFCVCNFNAIINANGNTIELTKICVVLEFGAKMSKNQKGKTPKFVHRYIF